MDGGRRTAESLERGPARHPLLSRNDSVESIFWITLYSCLE